MAAMDTAEPSEILQCSFETKNGDVVEIVTTKQTWNEKRSFLRSETSGGLSGLRISKQVCSVENCQARLVALVEACDLKYDKKRSKLIGLICVLETLLLPSQRGFMTFEHAYELYFGYQEGLPDKENFRDELLND